MTCVEIGNLRGYNGMPGILIEADKDELRKISGNILYQSVAVFPENSVTKKNGGKDPLVDNRLSDQIERCGAICTRLNADRRKKYSVAEVEAIIDELLDGIKPGKDKA